MAGKGVGHISLSNTPGPEIALRYAFKMQIAGFRPTGCDPVWDRGQEPFSICMQVKPLWVTELELEMYSRKE